MRITFIPSSVKGYYFDVSERFYDDETKTDLNLVVSAISVVWGLTHKHRNILKTPTWLNRLDGHSISSIGLTFIIIIMSFKELILCFLETKPD